MLHSLVISYRHFGEAGSLHLLGGPKSLKTTVHHIPEDCKFQQQCCENLKSNTQRPSQIKSHLHNQEMPLFSKLWQILSVYKKMMKTLLPPHVMPCSMVDVY